MSKAIELFLLGVMFSLGPCLISCEPVLLPYVAATRRGWREGLTAVLVFSASRLLAIVLAGGVVGAMGEGAAGALRRHQAVFFYGAGGLLCAFGVVVSMGRNTGWAWCDRLHGLCARDKIAAPAVMGAAIGLLPCLPFLGVLVLIAAEARGWHEGVFLGLAFGLGKTISPILPLGLLAGALPERLIKGKSGLSLFRRLGGAVLAIAGVHLIALELLRGR